MIICSLYIFNKYLNNNKIFQLCSIMFCLLLIEMLIPMEVAFSKFSSHNSPLFKFTCKYFIDFQYRLNWLDEYTYYLYTIQYCLYKSTINHLFYTFFVSSIIVSPEQLSTVEHYCFFISFIIMIIDTDVCFLESIKYSNN